MEIISARVEDEKRVIEIQKNLMEELRADRVRRERWEEMREREERELLNQAARRATWRRRHLWIPTAVLFLAILFGGTVARSIILLRNLDIL